MLNLSQTQKALLTMAHRGKAEPRYVLMQDTAMSLLRSTSSRKAVTFRFLTKMSFPFLMTAGALFCSISATNTNATDYYTSYSSVSETRQIIGSQWDSEDNTTISYRFSMGGVSPPVVSRSINSCVFNGSNTALADMEYAVTVYDYGTNDELFRSEFVPCGTIQTIFSQIESEEAVNAYKITLRRIDGGSLTGSMMFNSSILLSGDYSQNVYNTTAIPDSWKVDTTQTTVSYITPDSVSTSTVNQSFIDESMAIPPKIVSFLNEVKAIFSQIWRLKYLQPMCVIALITGLVIWLLK